MSTTATGSPSALFTPVSIGPVRLRNRTIRAAAFEGMSDGHDCTEALVDYHGAVAEGGVGMTTVAYAAVERTGLSFAHQLWLRPEAVPGLRRLTDRVHAAGAAASIQIGHTGNMAHASVTGERPMAPSARLNLYGPSYPRAMDASDIARLVRSFGEAVRLAREAGFDAVEVHAGHGYLISQFLSPWTNRRRDAWGGSRERRLRLLREVMAAVLAEADRGGTAVLVKMNLRDGFDGGCDLDDALEVARTLERDGAHALVLSAGFVSRAPMVVMHGAMPTRVMGTLIRESGARLLGLAVRLAGRLLIAPVPFRENYFLDDALVVRGAVRMPLVYVGGAASRAAIDRALAGGFEAVALARALIREPDFVARLAREEAAGGGDGGEAGPRCDHCNYCAARIYTTRMSCHHVEPPPPSLVPFIGPAGAR